MHPRPGITLLLALAVSSILAAQPPGEPQAPSTLGVDSALMMGEPSGRALAGNELDQTTEELSSLMRCPVCQGLSVAASPTPLAQAMKGEVRQMLAAGYSRDQILEYFERSYGEFIRLAPKPKGFNLFVWIAPVAGLFIGLGLVVWYLRKGRGEGSIAEVEDEELAAYRNRVRQELGS